MSLRGVLTFSMLTLLSWSAQDEPARRERLVGRIQDRARRPWSGARVFLLSRPVPGLDSVGEADEVETVSDARGRFRAMLLRGRSYTVWAAEAAETGSYRRTRTAEDVHAGRPVRLEESNEPGVLSRCRISGREAWDQPLRFRLTVDTENRHVLPVEPDAGGEFVFPMLPEGELYLEMYGEGGTPLCSTRIAGSIETREIPLQRPCPVVVRVSDQSGKAVAGASIYRQLRSGRAWQRVAVTEEEGTATVRLPGNQVFTDGTLRVRARLRADSPGHALGRVSASVRLAPGRDLSRQRASGKADITLRLRPGLSLKGKLLLDESRPAPGMPLLIYGPLVGSRRSWTHPVEPMLYRTREDGCFEIPGRHESSAHRLCAVLSDSLIQSFSPPGPPLHPVVVLSLGADDRRTDLGTLRLDEIPAYDIEVQEPDGSAVACPALMIGAEDRRIEGAIGPYHGMRVPVGRRGRVRLLSRDPGHLVLLASSGLRFGWRHLEEGTADAAFPIVLGAGVPVTGRVVDASKQPIPNAMVYLSPSRSRELASSRLLRWVGAAKTTTDEEGRFELRVRPGCDYRIWASAPDSAGRLRHSPRETIRVGDTSPSDHELILGREKKKEPPRSAPMPPGGRRRR